MITVSATTARSRLYDLIEEVSVSGKRVGITNKGETKAILMSPEEIASWEATMETLADKEVMDQIKESERDIKAGKVHDWEDVKKELGLTDVQTKIVKSRKKRA